MAPSWLAVCVGGCSTMTSTANRQNKTVANATAPLIHNGASAKNSCNAANAERSLPLSFGAAVFAETKPDNASCFHDPIDSRSWPKAANSDLQAEQVCKCAAKSCASRSSASP